MQISPVYSNYSFKANFLKKPSIQPKQELLEGQIMRDGEIFNRHSSYYFRDDLHWKKFGKYLVNKYQSIPKVNTYIWGCANGEEAYTMAMLLKHLFKADNKKFLPIHAMDIEEHLIKKNKNFQEKGFFVSDVELFKMKDVLGVLPYSEDLYKYCLPVGCLGYRFRDDIINSVEFSQSNILTGLDRIDSNIPSIVMCRNMWPYIDGRKYDNYLRKLHSKLSPNSIVVIGSYDVDGDNMPFSRDFPKSLTKNGFIPVKGMLNDAHCFWFTPNNATLVYEK